MRNPVTFVKTAKRTQRASLGLFIDGHIFDRRQRKDEAQPRPRSRLASSSMSGSFEGHGYSGVGIQIIYPSTLLEEVTSRDDQSSEVAICESYNRWTAKTVAAIPRAAFAGDAIPCHCGRCRMHYAKCDAS